MVNLVFTLKVNNMSEIHFFIELDKLPVYNSPSVVKGQGPNDAYGCVVGSEETHYRVTSKFNLNVNADGMAYAVTDGTILIQPQFDDVTQLYSTTRVNVILKPFISPNNGFTSVDYFIYRGLRRDNFFQSNNSLIAQNTSGISDFMKEVWNDFLVGKTKGIVDPDNANQPVKDRIGFHIDSEADTITLSDVFNRNRTNQVSGKTVQLSSATMGWSLGRFDSSGPIGFEIILKDKLYTPTLATARATDHIIITTNTPTPNDTQGDLSIGDMREREQILNFIDPAAYFMTFNSVSYRNSSLQNIQNASGINAVAQTILNPFYTKDIVYLDFRNEFGYSLNYHRDSQGDSTDPNSEYSKHFRLCVNQGPNQTLNYYKNFWPVYTFKIPNATSQLSSYLEFAFRTQYFPDQLIYIDFGEFVDQFGKITQPGNSDRFLDGELLPGPSNFSEFYSSFSVYNLPSPIGYAPSQIIKLILIRRTPPNTSLPISSIARDEYLDNLFGPLSTLPPSTSTVGTEQSLGKRYLNLSPYYNDLECMVEVSLLYDDDDVIFMANVISYRSKNGPVDFVELNTMKFVQGNLVNSSVSNYIKTQFADALQWGKVDINTIGTSIVVPTYFFQSDIMDKRKFLFGIALSRIEYVNRILPAAATLNSNLHETYLNLVTFNENTGTNNWNSKDITYYDTLLKVSGFDNLGVYQEVAPVGGNMLVYSLDRHFISSESNGFTPQENNLQDPYGAFIELNDFLNYIDLVEKVYADSDKRSSENDSSVKNTATRIRVHSYGTDTNSGIIGKKIGEAFETALPDADYSVDWFGFNKRNMEKSDMDDIDGGVEAFNRLTSHADEYWFRDNPSPYFLVKTSYESVFRSVDMGQILYGLESLIIPNPQAPTIGGGYRSSNSGYPIDIPFDLTGTIANIATPIADALYHRIFGYSGRTKSFIFDARYTPQTADLFAYYELSAPESDLLANADAIGLLNAYLNLLGNSNLRLSDVLKYYYKNELRSGITVTGNQQYSSVEKRWLMFAIYFDMVKAVGSQYRWMPDSTIAQDISEWEVTSDGIKSRMYSFAEFWWNQYPGINMQYTMKRILNGRNTPINRFQDIFLNDPSQIAQINSDTEACLNNFFLPFVKNELIKENGSIII